MFKNRTRSRYFALIALVFALITVSAPLPAQALPCYDLWQGCLAGGGGDNFCEGMWCGCMYREYGYACAAQVQ
jgi:hypothetical protein